MKHGLTSIAALLVVASCYHVVDGSSTSSSSSSLRRQEGFQDEQPPLQNQQQPQQHHRMLKGEKLPWPDDLERPAYPFDQSIVNGNVAAEGQFPWYVKFEGVTLCGGSLIHEDIVLTAGHCVDGDPPDSVRIGGINDDGGKVINVCGSVVHPDYNDIQLLNDVAILKLCSPAFGTVVPLNNNRLYPSTAGQSLTTLGYGRVSSDGTSTSILQYLQMGFVTDRVCSEAFGGHVADQNICADTSGGICFGDSGGPLVDASGKQVGIASFIIDSCDSEFPDFFSDVALFYEWIQLQVCNNSNNKPAGQCAVNPGNVLVDVVNFVGRVAFMVVNLFMQAFFG